jgi:hypothetical protein
MLIKALTYNYTEGDDDEDDDHDEDDDDEDDGGELVVPSALPLFIRSCTYSPTY